MQKTIRLSWIFMALTLGATSTTPAGAISQYVIQNASSAYTFNLTQTCSYLDEITVGGSPVYNAILDDLGDTPLWKVVFMERVTEQPPGTLSNIEFTSTDAPAPTVVQDEEDQEITITWLNCGNATYHFNVVTFFKLGDAGVYGTIEVQNSTADEPTIKYRLMEVHFPYVVLGPSSFVSPPESGDDRLSMNTYVLESPAERILPELPYPTPVPTPIQKNSWNTDFGKGNARYPFNLYYKDDCLNSTDAACGFYFAVYNSFGYPCQVNFAKNVDPSFSADSFFYDVVLYPHGYDIIDTPQNDFTMPPGMYIECSTPMKGNWYDAAQRYRTQTDLLASIFASPTPGLPVPETTATPIWHTTPIHANSNIPNYVKNASIIYYVSPQVSDYDFCVNGQYPVAEQARRLKDYLFTDQSPAVYNRIQALSQFPVMTWPFLLQGPQSTVHPYFAPEWAGGNYPVTNQSRYDDHCRAHTSELVALLQQTGTPTPGVPSPLNLKFMIGSGAVYHFNDEMNWQVHPLFGIFPTPTPPGYVPMLHYGCESNAEWGNDIIGTIQDSLLRKYINVIPPCYGSPPVFNVLWKSTTPRGFINTYMDARDGTSSFIGADIDYAGWNIRMCLGDYTTGEDHGHPRNGGNVCLSAWQKHYREFHQQYGSSKAILLEDPSHAYLGSCDLFHTSFFPAIDPGKIEEPTGTGMAKKLKYLLVDTSSDYIRHVPIPQVIAHDRIPMFDGMSGYITGTQFHPEYGQTRYTGYRFNFYHQPTPTPGVTPSDPFKPIRSLNADLAYSYINGNRILVMDVDQPVDAAGTPLPTLTPTPTGTIPIAPIVTPTPPACAYGFMDEPSIATSRTLLKTLVTSYVYYANQQMYDELYKPLFSGRMLRAPEIQPLTPVALSYDNATGNPSYEDEDFFSYELTSSPVLTSAWHSPSNLPEYVVLSFINFDGAPKWTQTQTFDMTSYFASTPGTSYVYKRVLYHDPSTLGSVVTISNPQQFSISIQIPNRSVRHFKIFRVPQLGKDLNEQWIDGDYINWNGDDFSDRIEWSDETLRLSLGLADGQLGEEITIAQNVLDVCAVDVTGDALTDLLCLTEDALEIFSYSEDKALLRHVFSSKSNGNPLRMSLQEIQPSRAVFRIVSEHSIVDYSIETGSLDIAETVQIEIPSHRIETSLDAYLNADEWVDTVASTDDGTILLIGEDEAGMRIFDAIPLDEDVRVSSIDDIDLDSDADIVLEYTGKKLTGQPLYLKNQGEWKFQ